MRKIITLILIAVLACTCLVGCNPELNNGSEDILYNGIVYKRYGYLDYNLDISEENAKYIGDFIETYDYGQELPWEVYALNNEENLLYTAYTNWVKPGYELPKCFGEEFTSVEYVIPNGIDFKIIPDEYSEQVFPIKTFEGSVKLEDIVESKPSDVTEFTEHNSLRFFYKNHADIRLWLDICSANGKYYLNVKDSKDGTSALHEIKPEYVELLTSAIPKSE